MGKITPVVKTIIVLVAFLGFTNFILSGSSEGLEDFFKKKTLSNLSSMPVVSDNLNSEKIPTTASPVSKTTEKGFSRTSLAAPTINLNNTNLSVCEDETSVSLTYTSTTENPNKYNITFSSQTQGFSNITNANLPSGTISVTIPAGANPGTYTANLKVFNSTEESQEYSFSITINPTPTVNDVQDIVICNGEAVSTNFSGSTVSGTTYNWTNNTTSIGLPASGTGNIASFNAMNSGNSPITAIITIAPKANNCEGASKTYNITVNPTPTINDVQDIVVCNGEAISTNFSGSSVSGTTYNWTNNTTSIGLPASGTGNIASFNAMNSGSSSVTTIITVTPKTNNCEGASKTYNIIVNPTPTVNDVQDIVICNGEAVSTNFSGSSVSGTTYNWTNNTTSIGLSANGTGNISSFNAVNSGSSPVTAIITVTPKANNCEGASKTYNIIVNPTPTVNEVDDIVVCNGEAVSTAFSGSSVSGTIYHWTNNVTSIGLSTNGTGNFSFNAINSGSSPITTTITITPEANNCDGIPQTFEITVNPTAIVSQPTNIIICDGEVVSEIIFAESMVSGTTYNWVNNNTATGLGANGTGKISSFTARNTTNEPLTSTITITPEANNCEGTEESFTITVNPTPTVQKPNNVVVCDASSTSQVTLQGSSVTGTTYQWTNSNPAIGLGASGEGNIPSFTAVNNSINPATAEITVIPVANDCEGIPEIFTITINPFPAVTAPGDQIYCNGIITEAIPLSGTPSGIVYDISGGAAIGLTNKTNVTEIPSFTTLAGFATVTITPKANGCNGTAVTYSVTVNPTPTVSVSPASQAICSGGATNFNLSRSIAGTTFNWTVAEISPAGSVTGASDSTGNKIEQTLTNSTTSTATVKYKIVPMANNCEGAAIFVTVTVNPTPELNITIPECVTSVDLTSTEITAGSTNELDFTYWLDSEATNTLNNPSEVGIGIYYIKGTSSAGCSIIEEVVVDKIQPVLNNIAEAPEQICSGEAFDFNPVSNIDGTIFSWTRGAIGDNPSSESGDRNAENPSESLVNQTTNTITATYTFTLTASNGCTRTQEIQVEILPEPILIEKPILDKCNGDLISYTPESSLSGSTITWRRNAFENNAAANGTGSISEKLYNDSGNPIGVTYFLTIESPEGCSTEDQVSFSLLSGPKVEVSATSIEICPGTSINLFSNIEGVESLDPVLLDEDFNGSASNWITENNSQNGDRLKAAWTLRPNNYSPPNYGNNNINSIDNSQFYFSNSDAQGSNGYTETILRYKNPIDTEGYSSLQLSFWQLYQYSNSNSIGEIEVSTDGNNWNRVYSIQRNESGVETVDLNGYIGTPTLYLRFRYRAYWGYWWAIDNVKITGEGLKIPDITWTSSTDPEWTSKDQNPVNIVPSSTTIYTATYTDPDIECPGIGTVEVVVRQTPPVTITANYCGDSSFIELTSDNEFSSYRWESGGEVLGTERKLNVEIASTYTLTVTDEFGCTGNGSINVSDELITNGSFENGATGFYTDYRNKTGTGDLYPEGDFAVDDNAREYHNDFNGRDHTTGNGNFMIINGSPGSGKVIWKQTIDNIQPNTDYYFNAWGMNVNPKTPARLQFRVNGQPTGTVADLRGQPVGTWVKFYSNPFWNSGNATTAILEIINLETIRDGNDFGIDDISFGTLEPIVFGIDPGNNSPHCSGATLELYANITGGRAPIKYTWTNKAGEIVSIEENPVFENVTAENSGVYTLTVTDAFGCEPTIGTTTVKIYAEVQIEAGEDFSICAESAEIPLNGSVTGSVSTGTWSGGSGIFTLDNTALDAIYIPSTEEIATGTVTLTLTSDVPGEQENPCPQVTDEITITINPTPEIVLEKTDLSCFESNDGIATVSITSGTAPFTFEWKDNAGQVLQTTQTATGLAAGIYTVTVNDAASCSSTSAEIEVLQPIPLEITGTSFTQPTCYGEQDGMAIITMGGGFIPDVTAPNYTYFITDTEGNEIQRVENSDTATFTAEGLSAGNYTFTVSIANDCSSTAISVTLVQPDPITVDAGQDIVFDQCGVLTTTLSARFPAENETGLWTLIDGTGGTFSDNLSASSEFTGLPSTSYTLSWTITNDVGCVNYEDVVVTFPESCSTLDFDGVDDYISFENNYNFTGAFSVEAWIKPHNITGVKTILSKRNSEDINSGGYDLILNNGFPTFRINGTSITTNFKVNINRWHHIAGTFDGTTAKLYVDGIELKSLNPPSGPISNTAPFLMGAMNKTATPLIPTNYFHGWIEEVRLWNRTISTDQLRFMMNQPIKDNGNVRGVEIPFDVPGNIDWDDLTGYYQMNKVQNGYVPGETNSAIKGKLINITTSQENTAPLPYILYTEGNNWYNTTTWKLPQQLDGKNITNRDVWESPNSVGVDRMTKIDWNIVQIDKNIHNPGTPNNLNDITLLALISKGGTFNMDGSNNMTGNGLTITHYLKLDGVVDLNGESQLIQTEGSVLDEDSGGYIERDQQGTKNSFNYNYWSSPVSLQRAANNSGFKISSVLKNGTTPASPANITFGTAHTFADDAYTGNLRISSYWLNIFHGTADDYGEWHHITQDALLPVGTGYTMKGTSGAVPINNDQNYIFTGKPNNGTITLAISDHENRLVGNPYPSAIDMNEFILDNLKDVPEGKNSQNVFNGAIYFWDHFGKEDTHNLAEYVGGYATYNLSGGAPGVSSDRRINSNGSGGGKRPERWIPVGQGFFVNTDLDEAVSGYYNIHGGNITFKNSQRIFVRENPGYSSFLKPEIVTKGKQAVFTEDNRYKIRLNYKSPTGYHRQILVTADSNTTNGFDLAYDAPLIDDIPEDIFWLINTSPFVIQAVSNFNLDQVLPLGLKVIKEGEYTISIGELENIPEDMNIYLRDKKLNIYYDLREHAFTSTGTPGYFSERFELVFQEEKNPFDPEEEEEEEEEEPGNGDDEQGQDKDDDEIIEGQPQVFYLNDTHELLINNRGLHSIEKIILYGLTGQIIEEYHNIETSYEVFLPTRSYSSAVYVVRLFTEQGTIQKKIIITN